jgi:hypothetical protein
MNKFTTRVAKSFGVLFALTKRKPWAAGFVAILLVAAFTTTGFALARQDKPAEAVKETTAQKQDAPSATEVQGEATAQSESQQTTAQTPAAPASKPATTKDFDIALTASALTVPVGSSSEGFTASTTDGRAVMWSFEKSSPGLGFYATPGMLPGAKQTATSSVWSKAMAPSNMSPGTHTLTVIATVPGTTTTKRKNITVTVTPAPSFGIEFGEVSGDADALQIIMPFYITPQNGHNAPISSVSASIVQCNPGIAVVSAVYTGATTGKITLSVAESVESPVLCTVAVTVGSQTHVAKDTFSLSD